MPRQIATPNPGTVDILLGNGDGTFYPPPPTELYFPDSLLGAIVAGDFTGSGHLDLAVADRLTDEVLVLLGNGDGTFVLSPYQPPISIGNAVSPLIGYMSLVVGQFTHDGHDDLAVVNNDVINGDSVEVLLGNGARVSRVGST